MVERIHNYFRSLGLDDEEAESLHMRYYKEYGLAIRGLVQHHAIDPLDMTKSVTHLFRWRRSSDLIRDSLACSRV